MRAAPLIVLGCLVSVPAFAGVWSNLWRTPDQQGEALLADGRPAQAAARFASRRRKAYADLEAGRYARAARLLAPFKDATSEYNRGNALAHLGHLRAALAAYDAALKKAPHDRDIRHNRDLVARILAHRPARRPKKPQSGTGKTSGQNGSHGGRSGQKAGPHKPGKGQSRGTHQGAGHGQHATRGQNAGGNAARHGKTPAPAGGRHNGQGKPSAARAGGSAGGHGMPRAGASSAQPAAPAGPNPHHSGQARRDAALAAAIARQERQGPRGNAASAARAGPHQAAHRSLLAHFGGQRSPPPKPASEKTLALDQWLRQIPNDPAGLLRRKFLIEYLLRHPGANR